MAPSVQHRATVSPRSRRDWQSPLWAALGCALGVALVCVAFLWTPAGQHADDMLLADGSGHRNWMQYESAREVLRLIGNPVHLAVALVILILAGLLLRNFVAGIAGVAVVLGSVAAARLLKAWIARPGLDTIAPMGSAEHNSFPSGHVAAAAGMVFAIALLAPPKWRWWLIVPGLAGVGVVIAATIVAGWHRLSDGLGAVLVAATLYCLAVAWTRRVSVLR